MRRILASEQAGLVLVIATLGILLTAFAGSHVDRLTGTEVNNFFNSYTLIQTATDASFFAVMAVGATIVIISGGIDLSVGSIYALAGVTAALGLRALCRLLTGWCWTAKDGSGRHQQGFKSMTVCTRDAYYVLVQGTPVPSLYRHRLRVVTKGAA